MQSNAFRGLLLYSLALLGAGGVLRSLVTGFYIANEGLSLLENFGIMGVPYPKVMKDAFEALKEKTE